MSHARMIVNQTPLAGTPAREQITAIMIGTVR